MQKERKQAQKIKIFTTLHCTVHTDYNITIKNVRPIHLTTN